MTPDPQKVDVTEARPVPHQRWQCGHASLGQSCASGPTADGKCGLNPENPCESGASRPQQVTPDGILAEKCEPRKSAWFSRRTAALNVAILVSGILLLCMSSAHREAIYVPGQLSQPHSQILGNTLVSDRCSLCHPNSHPDSPSGLIQDQLCMACHTTHIPDASRRSPHDLASSELRILQSRAIPAKHFVSTKGSGEQIAIKEESSAVVSETFCAQCHVEHHGSSKDLKAITDRRCQACHQQQFASFSEGHPQFDGYPYRSERRLAFDHSSHAGEYFGKKNEQFDCRRCHIDIDNQGIVGNVFRTVGFEKACASCHADSIRSESINGWAILQVPCVPESVLQGNTPELAEWPSNAVFDYDGQLSLAARILLGNDAALVESLRRVPASGKISEISDESRSEDVPIIAIGFRKLVSEIAVGGQAAWSNRIRASAQRILGRELNAREQLLVSEASAGLPPDLFRYAETKWFQRADRFAQTNGPIPTAETSQSQVSGMLASTKESASENWKLQLAHGHSQDDTEVLSEPTNGQLISEEWGNTSRLSSASGQGIAQWRSRFVTDGRGGRMLELTRASSQTTSPLAVEETTLAVKEAQVQESEQDAEEESSEMALFNQSESDDWEEWGGTDDDLDSTDSKLVHFNPAEHVASGGWYVDEQTLAIRYVPRGHADRFLAAWGELISVLESARENERNASHPWPSDGVSMGNIVPGSCTECHQIGGSETAMQIAANWTSSRRPANTRLFTRFDHTPHLSLPEVNDCRYCHQFRTGSQPDGSSEEAGQSIASLRAVRESFVTNHELSNGVSHYHLQRQSTSDYLTREFQSMERAQCVACHRPGGANDGCTQCHLYHVGSEGFQWSRPN